jgi:hypothetical protein
MAGRSALAAENAALRAEVERLRVAGWQPIETAPQDGTVIMIHVTAKPNLPPYTCRADDYWNGAWWLETATHWMPLPAPPARAALDAKP